MKALLVGGGGREDALAWALARSERVRTLRCAPGNPGIARHAECVPLQADDVAALAGHAIGERYDLVVVGPEAPLVAGLADRLRAAGLPVFGPSAAAALLEGSKVFAKQFMARHRIPTGSFSIFSDAGDATRWLLSEEASYPLVVKADGLAAGKGVVIAQDPESAIEAAEGMLTGERFGEAGSRILVEEMLRGREASFFVLTDGERIADLATCQDYKRAEDGDRGPNTGGMGSYSPSVYLDDAMRRRLVEEIVAPTIAGLAAEGRTYRGVLYVGVMLTDAGPKVLEFNARFGDPEAQVLVPRLDGDWVPFLLGCAAGGLGGVAPRWRSEAAVCVVMASGGYPGPYRRDVPIRGIEEAESLQDVLVFHAGTASDGTGVCRTAGGRVLGVTALAATLSDARTRAYEAVSRIRWEAERHRTDIALDAIRIVEGRRAG